MTYLRHKKTGKVYAAEERADVYAQWRLTVGVDILYLCLNPKTGKPWQAMKRGKLAHFEVLKGEEA